MYLDKQQVINYIQTEICDVESMFYAAKDPCLLHRLDGARKALVNLRLAITKFEIED